jgi:hypothetical protein
MLSVRLKIYTPCVHTFLVHPFHVEIRVAALIQNFCFRACTDDLDFHNAATALTTRALSHDIRMRETGEWGRLSRRYAKVKKAEAAAR